MKTLTIAALVAAFAAPAFAIDANHFESPAEAAAYGQSFDGSADVTVLYAGIDSPAEQRGLKLNDGNGVVSTKNVGGFNAVLTGSLESPAEIAARR